VRDVGGVKSVEEGDEAAVSLSARRYPARVFFICIAVHCAYSICLPGTMLPRQDAAVCARIACCRFRCASLYLDYFRAAPYFRRAGARQFTLEAPLQRLYAATPLIFFDANEETKTRFVSSLRGAVR